MFSDDEASLFGLTIEQTSSGLPFSVRDFFLICVKEVSNTVPLLDATTALQSSPFRILSVVLFLTDLLSMLSFRGFATGFFGIA